MYFQVYDVIPTHHTANDVMRQAGLPQIDGTPSRTTGDLIQSAIIHELLGDTMLNP